MSAAPEAARRLGAAGQEEARAWLAALPEEPRERLARQVLEVDFDLLGRLHRGEHAASPPGDPLVEPPFFPAGATEGEEEARRAGEAELRAGRVGYVLVAGGQASRLRWGGPKGTFPIGPRSDRTLFRVLAERVVRAGRRHGAVPPFAVTTSPGTDAATREAFSRDGGYGLPPSAPSFASQRELPALDDAGRLLLAAPDRLFTSPDGHGGAVLAASALLAAWRRRGVRVVGTFQVDDPLLPVVDPVFLGRLLLGGAPVATKVVRKRDPGERVGVVVLASGRPRVVEYSELATERAAARRPDGELALRLGSIAVHLFDLEFLLEALAEGLPWHAASRDALCLDARGVPVPRPARKFERFLFDLFPRAPSIAVVEVRREREYAPLKQAEGPDAAADVRAALDREYRRWYAEARRAPPGAGPLELSPLEAEGPADLLQS